MKAIAFSRRSAGLFTVVLTLADIGGVSLLVGCGGSGSTSSGSSVVAAATGRATVTIIWPTQSTTNSRLIPVDSKSIIVSFSSNNSLVTQQIVARPTTSNTSVVNFRSLPTGMLTARAAAYPNTDGTGVPQAVASVSATIISAQNTAVAITMNSTVNRLVVAPSSATLVAGATTALSETAYDNGNDVVLTSTSTFGWSSSNIAVATVSSTGVVTAIAAGTATITVNESESGVTATVPITVQAAGPQIVYQNNFEGLVGPEWSQTNTEITPLGARRFLGRFGPVPVSLSLANLPTHKSVTISFKLFIIRSWDGNLVTNNYGAAVGPDLWTLSLDNQTLLHTTFGNWEAGSTTDNVLQSYPNAFGSGAFPSRTGASENNTLGYPSFQPPYPGPYQDAVYDLTFTTTHTATTATFIFTGGENEDISDESWGIDDVVVSVSGS